jgi:predicted metalloprotease with PDZ domain
MFRRHLLALIIVVASSAPEANAQVRSYNVEPGRSYTFTTNEDGDRAVLGVTTSTGSARDTLGVLLNSVTAGGPADKAGIEEGTRVASINGVNLKLASADVGDWEMASAMQRRFTREMAKVKAGDEVDLRVYYGGQAKSVKVKTVTYDDLYNMQRRTLRDRERDPEDRAALGVSLGSSGSKRDTLGVLIMGLDDEGPAAKAGLEEGNRIQSINGVDLRVGREDAGDAYLGSTKVRRLQRELEKVKVGDEVTLKVYTGAGRTRDVKIKTVPQSDFRRRGGMSFFGTSPMAFPMPPMEMERMIEPEVRLRIQDEMGRVRERLQEIAPAARAIVRNRIVI